MPPPLSLAMAARLVRVPRGTLQRMIAAGDLVAHEGRIAVEDLQRHFPQIAVAHGLTDSGALEKVAQIREQAFARRMREIVLPSQEILAQRLFDRSVELAQIRRLLQAYHAMVVSLRARLDQPEAPAAARREIIGWLDAQLQRILAMEAEPGEETVSMLEATTSQVTVRPSGRHFLVEGGDSLLQAGLKAGLRLGYGCGTGSCGLCKARVVSGDIRAIGHADYRLSEQERQQGMILLCSHTAISDVTLETLEADGPQDIPDQEIVARVRALSALSADTMLLHLQTPRTHRLRFLAGQCVTLGVADGRGDVAQSLPLANCPCDERNLHFHIGRESGGAIAALVAEGRLKAGDPVDIRGPFGAFVLQEDAARSPVFIACDTGFAPVKSLIEHAIASDQFESISLYWLATRQGGHYLANLCRSWSAGLDNFHYVPIACAEPVDGARQIAARLLTDSKDIAATNLYLAGPPAFNEALLGVLARNGVRREHLRSLDI